MKRVIILLSFVAIVAGCDRNRVGDEEGYVESEATERSTIKTGTSERDAQTAQPGSATGPGGETSGGTFGTGQYEPGSGGSTAPGQTSTNVIQPAPKK